MRTAAAAVALRLPDSPAAGELVLRLGTQLDAHPLSADGGGRITDEQVAAWVAGQSVVPILVAACEGILDREKFSSAKAESLFDEEGTPSEERSLVAA